LATDGSPSAAEAEQKALELARALEAPLVVVSVAHLEAPAVGYSSFGYSDVVAQLMEAEHKRVGELLAAVAKTAEAAGVACSTVVADGIAVEEIDREASERDAQLIVVGSHGLGRRPAALLRQRLDRPRPLGTMPRARRARSARGREWRLEQLAL
jgi:nucleotide-binding universal stress UspA family protein